MIASTLENNACKHFQCPREELDGILDEECVDLFIDLWENIYLHILPNFFGMVYSLEVSFVYFFSLIGAVKMRDGQNFVLVSVLNGIQCRNSGRRQWCHGTQYRLQ